MSIWKSLYDIYDSERSRWQQQGTHKQALAFELHSNLTFLADAIYERLDQQQIIKGLERKVFDQSMKNGFSINSLNSKNLAAETIGEFDEFKKYLGKDTEYLVKNVYLKIGSLTKLAQANKEMDCSLRLKSLFRFLMLVVAHIQGEKLTLKISNNK